MMYVNNIVIFLESTTILNAWTKKSGKLLNTQRMQYIFFLMDYRNIFLIDLFSRIFFNLWKFFGKWNIL